MCFEKWTRYDQPDDESIICLNISVQTYNKDNTYDQRVRIIITDEQNYITIRSQHYQRLRYEIPTQDTNCIFRNTWCTGFKYLHEWLVFPPGLVLVGCLGGQRKQLQAGRKSLFLSCWLDTCICKMCKESLFDLACVGPGVQRFQTRIQFFSFKL